MIGLSSKNSIRECVTKVNSIGIEFKRDKKVIEDEDLLQSCVIDAKFPAFKLGKIEHNLSVSGLELFVKSIPNQYSVDFLVINIISLSINSLTCALFFLLDHLCLI